MMQLTLAPPVFEDEWMAPARYDVRMAKFVHIDRSLGEPRDIVPYLGKKEKHWTDGRSAKELAHSWIDADGIPASVAGVLNTCEYYADARLLMASLEHDTALGGRGYGSQTDLLALLLTKVEPAVVCVEGKVDEPFGPLVSEWLARGSGTNRQTRIDSLKRELGLRARVSDLRYQLLHRTAAAVIEARKFGVRQAMMLVHSFCPQQSSFREFQEFAEALGIPVERVNSISAARQVGDVSLRLGWVDDRARG